MNKLQKQYIKEESKCGINEGDEVKILRAADDYERGWNNTFEPEMVDFVGSVLRVMEVGNKEGYGIRLAGGDSYPYFCLGLVE